MLRLIGKQGGRIAQREAPATCLAVSRVHTPFGRCCCSACEDRLSKVSTSRASASFPSFLSSSASAFSTSSLLYASAKRPAMVRHFSLPSHEVLEMPALSPTMEKGNLASWEKKIGEKINVGDVLAQVETDKATVSFDSTEEGYLAKILVPAGTQDVVVGTKVAIMVEEEADVPAFANYSGSGAATAAPAAAASAAASAAAPAAAAPATPATTVAPSPSSSADGRIIASPLARKTANEKGINLAQVTGTGPNHRVVLADVLEFKPSAAPAPAATPAAVLTAKPAAPAVAAQSVAAPAMSQGDYTDIPLSNVRKVIASRLTQSKQQIPHYYITVDVQMDAIMKTRAELNKQLDDKSKLSVNDFIIKASALALKKVPDVNQSWMDTVVRRYSYVDVSVAVSTDGGLITPIVKDADLKGLVEISQEVKELAARARQNKLKPHEFQGGTFTLSNLGMFGVKQFSAIINPPQAAILATGSAQDVVVANPNAKEGELPFKTVKVMHATASFDHRVVDGAVGAQWLQAFKQYCENPVTMLL